jgi:hypothetical protein
VAALDVEFILDGRAPQAIEEVPNAHAFAMHE